jgi:hypothetical protein
MFKQQFLIHMNEALRKMSVAENSDRSFNYKIK